MSAQVAILSPPRPETPPTRALGRAAAAQTEPAGRTRPVPATLGALLHAADRTITASTALGEAQREREVLRGQLAALVRRREAASALQLQANEARARLQRVTARVAAVRGEMERLAAAAAPPGPADPRAPVAKRAAALAGAVESARDLCAGWLGGGDGSVPSARWPRGEAGAESLRVEHRRLVRRLVRARSRAVEAAGAAALLGPVDVSLSQVAGARVVETLDRGWWSAAPDVKAPPRGRPHPTLHESSLSALGGGDAAPGVLSLSIGGADMEALNARDGLNALLEGGDEDVNRRLAAGLGAVALLLPALGMYVGAPLKYRAVFGGSLSMVSPATSGRHHWAPLATYRGGAAPAPTPAPAGGLTPAPGGASGSGALSPEVPGTVTPHTGNNEWAHRATSFDDLAQALSASWGHTPPPGLPSGPGARGGRRVSADEELRRRLEFGGERDGGAVYDVWGGRGAHEGAAARSRLSVGVMEAVRGPGPVDFTRPSLQQCLELLQFTHHVDLDRMPLPLDCDTALLGLHLLPQALHRAHWDVCTMLAQYGLDVPGEANLVEGLYLLTVAAGSWRG